MLTAAIFLYIFAVVNNTVRGQIASSPVLDLGYAKYRGIYNESLQ